MKYYLTDEEAEKKYGKEMIEKMEATGYLTGITCIVDNDGKTYCPERDYELALRAVKGKPIHPNEID
jgi:hypothetical protein